MNKEDIKLGAKLTLRRFNNAWEEVRNYDCVVVGYSLAGHPIVEFEEGLVSRAVIVENLDDLFPRLREVTWWAGRYKDSNSVPHHTEFFRDTAGLQLYQLPSGCEWISPPIAVTLLEPDPDE